LDARFGTFKRISVVDVIGSIRRLPNKSSPADPMPTSILKQVADLVSPFIARLFNLSLEAGEFPEHFKVAAITPIAKKPNIDASDVSCYRPITNLSVLSKLLERVVAAQLVDYLRTYNLLPPLQSGFRPGHSTETAVLKVLTDIRHAVDRGDVAALVLLDLSAAFDTVDHEILLQRMSTSFGIQDTAIRWFRSYLINRKQFVRLADTSSLSNVISGVPQGSVLGPLLFILYTADLIALIETHDLPAHLYADDTQIYGSCRPGNVDELSARLSDCTTSAAV
jgi:hypothetical protein